MRVRIDLTDTLAAFMLAEGWIGDADLKDAEVIEGALADMIECIAEGRLVRRHALLSAHFDSEAEHKNG